MSALSGFNIYRMYDHLLRGLGVEGIGGKIRVLLQRMDQMGDGDRIDSFVELYRSIPTQALCAACLWEDGLPEITGESATEALSLGSLRATEV